MNKNPLAVLLALAFLLPSHRGLAADQGQSVTPPVAVAESSASAKEAAPDSKRNRSAPFESTYQSSGPVPIHFTYATPGEKFSKDGNQLTIVTRARLTATNITRGVLGAAADKSRPETYATRDSIVGSEIEDIVNADKLENPALNDIPKLLDQKIKEYVADSAALQNKKYFEKLSVFPTQWTFVFHESADQPNAELFILKFRTTLSKPIEGDRKTLLHDAEMRTASCSFASAPKTLEQWKARDYAEVATLRPQILESCMRELAPSLPKILEEGEVTSPEHGIRSAQLMCKTEHEQCVRQAKDGNADAADAIKECKAEYTECRNEEVKPLRDATPIGQCKVALGVCKTGVIERAKSVSPETKPTRADMKVCVVEYKACVDETKKPKTAEKP